MKDTFEKIEKLLICFSENERKMITDDIPTPDEHYEKCLSDEHYEKCLSLDDVETARFMKKVIDTINESRSMSMTISTSGVPLHARRAAVLALRTKGWKAELHGDFEDGSSYMILAP